VSEATKPKLISVDWGTSNLRAYLIGREGQVTEQVSSNQGLLSQPENFEQCLLSLIGHWLEPDAPLNIILSGMVGSPSGWQEVPHLPAPATVQDLANGAARIAQPQKSSIWIVPGVFGQGAAGIHDIMRGEEVQFFGAELLRRTQSLPRPVYWCFPGTHNKWITAGTTIEQSSTSMVGEFFELARRHSLLAQSMENDSASTVDAQAKTDAFSRGLANAQLPGGLLHHLFSVRTLQLTNHHDKAIGADYLSGIVIGHDVLAQLGHSPTQVGIVAAPGLAARYTQALEALGHSCFTIDAQDATVAGAGLIENCLPRVE
jgi:2-dehydro-3-deoxygalactonokinase